MGRPWSFLDAGRINKTSIAALVVPFLVSCKLMDNMADCGRVERDLRSEMGMEGSCTSSSVKYWTGRRVTTVKILVREFGDAGTCDASCEFETRRIVHRDFRENVDTISITSALGR
jgi:hypothetical protein